MARREIKRAKTDLSWGSGSTDLFLHVSEGGIDLIDYEFEASFVHSQGGGKCYYSSRSGNSGEGYIHHYGELTPVGYYRVDTAHNDHQNWVEVLPGIIVMVPYATHTMDKSSIFEEYPVVIKQGSNKVIFVEFNELGKLLERLGTGKEPSAYTKPRKMKRKYEKGDSFKEVSFEFWDLFNGGTQYNQKKNLDAWEFVEVPVEYMVQSSSHRLFRIFHVTETESGQIVRTAKIDADNYAVGIIDNKTFDSSKTVVDTFRGWEAAEAKDVNIVFKHKMNTVFIVGWLPTQKACEMEFARISSRYNNVGKVNLQGGYIEYTLEIPKILFLMRKEEYIKEIWAGLKRKARKRVIDAIKAQKEIEELIGDDVIITVEDSVKAGNCRNGTEMFQKEYFPGRESVTSGEIKNFVSGQFRSYIIRVFEYMKRKNDDPNYYQSDDEVVEE